MFAWLKRLWRLMFGSGGDIPRPANLSTEKHSSMEKDFLSKRDPRTQRKIDRHWYQFHKRQRQKIGPPVLTGSRLARISRSCMEWTIENAALRKARFADAKL
jgi:hypothetical protein